MKIRLVAALLQPPILPKPAHENAFLPYKERYFQYNNPVGLFQPLKKAPPPCILYDVVLLCQYILKQHISFLRRAFTISHKR